MAESKLKQVAHKVRVGSRFARMQAHKTQEQLRPHVENLKAAGKQTKEELSGAWGELKGAFKWREAPKGEIKVVPAAKTKPKQTRRAAPAAKRRTTRAQKRAPNNRRRVDIYYHRGTLSRKKKRKSRKVTHKGILEW